MMLFMGELKKRGWSVEKGAYYGTSDDRADRWYAYRWDVYRAIDRRGPGFRTRWEAIEAASRLQESWDK